MFLLVDKYLFSSKHNSLPQCCTNTGPVSYKVDRHWDYSLFIQVTVSASYNANEALSWLQDLITRLSSTHDKRLVSAKSMDVQPMVTQYLTNVRRRTNIEATLGQCLVFVGLTWLVIQVTSSASYSGNQALSWLQESLSVRRQTAAAAHLKSKWKVNKEKVNEK